MSSDVRLSGVQPIEGVSGGEPVDVTDASAGATGAAVPADATYVGGANSTGKLTGASIGTKGGLVVEGVASGTAIPVSGSVTATLAGEGGTGGSLPTSAVYIAGANGSSKLTGASIGGKGGLVVEGVASGTAMPVSDSAISVFTTTTPITKSDDTDTTTLTRKGLWVGGAGDLIVKDLAGTQATLTIGAAGYVPGNVSRVMAATTATAIVGLS